MVDVARDDCPTAPKRHLATTLRQTCTRPSVVLSPEWTRQGLRNQFFTSYYTSLITHAVRETVPIAFDSVERYSEIRRQTVSAPTIAPPLIRSPPGSVDPEERD